MTRQPVKFMLQLSLPVQAASESAFSEKKVTAWKQRDHILRILYEKGARSRADAFNCDELAGQMKTSWEQIRQEIEHLERKELLGSKERQIGARIHRWIYLTLAGVEEVEGKHEPVPNSLELEVRGIETPMGEPLARSRLPYTQEQLIVLLKALRLPKYDPDEFTSDQLATLEQLELLRDMRFVPDILRNIGETLYKTLMQEDIHTAFQMSLNQSQSNNPIALQLRFDENAVELARYPWELLYYRRALLPSRTVELTRYISYPEAVKYLSVKPPLHQLYLRSRPTDLSGLPDEFEQNTVQQALYVLEEKGHISMGALPQPTFETFLDYLENHVVHILHFDGHGVFAKQCQHCQAMNYPNKLSCATCGDDIRHIMPQGYLAFEDSNRHVHWLSSESFSTLLCNRSVRLAVLSACRSGSVGGESLFAGIAPALIQAGVPAVVATQLPISIDGACKFFQGFYGALARFESVPAAVNAGRIRIFDTQEWFIPTLYLRSLDEQGHIFSFT